MPGRERGAATPLGWHLSTCRNGPWLHHTLHWQTDGDHTGRAGCRSDFSSPVPTSECVVKCIFWWNLQHALHNPEAAAVYLCRWYQCGQLQGRPKFSSICQRGGLVSERKGNKPPDAQIRSTRSHKHISRTAWTLAHHIHALHWKHLQQP